MRNFAALSALALLCACGKPAEAPKAALPNAPAVVADATVRTAPPGAFAGDFNALGTEPFWAIEVRPATLKLSRPDAIDLTVANTGPKIDGGKAVWSAPGLTLSLTKGTCSDGMSDRTYPYVAEATIGDATLKGCASQP